VARKAIPEKHAPEKTTSPGSTVQQPQYAPLQQYTNGNGLGEMSTNPTFDFAAAEQASFDDLQMFFTSDLGWTWQPAETAVGSATEGAGIPPWVTSLLR
jgi:hypothetical protein